jgi:hypothetical protein
MKPILMKIMIFKWKWKWLDAKLLILALFSNMLWWHHFFVFDLFCSRIFLILCFFFLCLVYFFALVLFLGCFHVKPRFLGCLWSNQKFQVNLVGSTQSSLPSQKHLGQRVYTLFGLPFCFAKGSFGLRVCLKNIP